MYFFLYSDKSRCCYSCNINLKWLKLYAETVGKKILGFLPLSSIYVCMHVFFLTWFALICSDLQCYKSLQPWFFKLLSFLVIMLTWKFYYRDAESNHELFESGTRRVFGCRSPNSDLVQSCPVLVNPKHVSPPHCCLPLQTSAKFTVYMWLRSIIIRYLDPLCHKPVTNCRKWSSHWRQDLIYFKGKTEMSQKKIGCPCTANNGKETLVKKCVLKS